MSTALAQVRELLARARAMVASLEALEGALADPVGSGAIVAAPRPTLHVLVDPGHGGHDPGAVALDGTKEKDLALGYGAALHTELTRRGHRVTMSRTDDSYPTLAARAAKADEVGADCLVSLHANAAESKAANGAWVIHDDQTRPGPTGGVALARAIFNALVRVPGMGDLDEVREIFADRTPAVGGRNLAVLSTKRAVAVLVELGFLTNEEDLRALKDEPTRQRVVRAIADGLETWAAGRG